MTVRRLPVLLLVSWCVGLISACEPAGVLVLDPAVEVAYGGRDDVSRAMRSAGSFSAPIRSVYLRENSQSSERSLSDIIETHEGARVFLPAVFLDLLEGIDDDQAQSVVVLGADISGASYGSVYFDNGTAVREASDAIAEHVQRRLDITNGVDADSDSTPPGEQFMLVLADERSETGRLRTETLFESLERDAVSFEHVSIERYSSDPGSDELRRVITRFGGDTELVVSTIPDFHGFMRSEAAHAGAQFAALYPVIRSTRQAAEAEEELGFTPVVQLVRPLETALRAGLSVDPGESHALELEVVHGL